MIKKIFNLFQKKKTFNPTLMGLRWMRLRYEDAAAVTEALNKLSDHGPLCIRWRQYHAEEHCYVGTEPDMGRTLEKMSAELTFSIQEVESELVPEPMTDKFALSHTIFTLQAPAPTLEAEEGVEEDLLDPNPTETGFFPIPEGDGWLYERMLFAHSEEGQARNIILPKNLPDHYAWHMPHPVLGIRVFPEWPDDLPTPTHLLWKAPDWVIGRTDQHETIGARQLQVFGDDQYTHLWLAALIAAREKQGSQTLVIDGEGDLLEYLYTEGRAFEHVARLDADGKTRIETNPLLPVLKLSGQRNIASTTEKWLNWFRAIDVPSSSEPLIKEAAADTDVVSINTLLRWLGKQSGDRYADATHLKNFIVPWLDDSVGWLMGETNDAEAILKDGRSLWVKCRHDNLRSRRGIYATVLMAAAANPDISIVLYHVPVDIQDIPQLAERHLVVCQEEPVGSHLAMVMTRSADLNLLSGMSMISGSQIQGIPEYIRQLQKYEAIVAMPSLTAEFNGTGRNYLIARTSWR
ncbi:MAG: hypothetical protein AAGD96_01505 [Chloroflexota bacterium]